MGIGIQRKGGEGVFVPGWHGPVYFQLEYSKERRSLYGKGIV